MNSCVDMSSPYHVYFITDYVPEVFLDIVNVVNQMLDLERSLPYCESQGD